MKPLNSQLPNQIKCQSCKKLYTWNNMPYALCCGHSMCIHCIEKFFISAISQNQSIIVINCSNCKNKGPLKYNRCDLGFEKFTEANFNINYSLLSYIYKHFHKNAISPESDKAPPRTIIKIVKIEPIAINYIRDDSVIEYNEDDDYEKLKEMLKIIDPPNTYMQSDDSRLTKYCCYGCNRIFNKRNIPLKMSCGHDICENCVVNLVRPKNKQLTFKCICGSGKVGVKMINVPMNYPMNWIARSILSPDKDLLKEIYNNISIDAKKAAWEFSLHKTPLNPIIESRLCCQKCKCSFSDTIPYFLACGHNTCLNCAYETISTKKALICSIDWLRTNANCASKDIPTLARSLELNTELRNYIKECYVDIDEEYRPDLAESEDNTAECAICYIDYDKDKHKPLSMCKNGHTICETCLKQILEKQLRSSTTGKAVIECVKCRETIDIGIEKEKNVDDYMTQFSSMTPIN